MDAPLSRSNFSWLAQKLFEQNLIRQRPNAQSEGLMEALDQVGALGTAEVIPDVLNLIGDRDQNVANAATSAIDDVLRRLNPSELIQLDRLVRARPTRFTLQQGWWDQLTPKLLVRKHITSTLPFVFWGLASMHRNGYVRLAAMHRLAENQDGSEIPYLLLRMNDWVSPVRAAAREALSSRFTPKYACQWVQNLPLVTRLEHCGRDQHAAFVASALEQIRAPQSRTALLQGMSSKDRAVRRTCFLLAIEAPDLSLRELLQNTLQSSDPILRLWATRTARTKLAPDDYLRLTPILFKDRFMPVRREALLGLLEQCPDKAEPAFKASLLDRSVSIREIARRFLTRSQAFDARSFYRQIVLAGPSDHLCEAIAGLGEAGTPGDSQQVATFLSHSSSKVRQAAVRAVGSLDSDARIDDLLHALQDNEPNVSRAARETLQRRLQRVAGTKLWVIFQRDQRYHVRRNVLSLLARLTKWTALPYLIRASDDHDTEIANRARYFVEDWISRFNRSFAKPSPEELRLAWEALDAPGSSLAPNIDQLIRFHLTGW